MLTFPAPRNSAPAPRPRLARARRVQADRARQQAVTGAWRRPRPGCGAHEQAQWQTQARPSVRLALHTQRLASRPQRLAFAIPRHSIWCPASRIPRARVPRPRRALHPRVRIPISNLHPSPPRQLLQASSKSAGQKAERRPPFPGIASRHCISVWPTRHDSESRCPRRSPSSALRACGGAHHPQTSCSARARSVLGFACARACARSPARRGGGGRHWASRTEVAQAGATRTKSCQSLGLGVSH